MSHKKIHIPKPCHENWLTMSPAEKGRFCHACEKTVYDFTKSSDRSILQKINTEDNVCGRFLVSQLDRELLVPKQKSTVWAAGIAGVLSLLSFGIDKLHAQEKPTVVQTDQNAMPTKMGDVVAATETERKIAGKVTENGIPMLAVNVVNKQSSVSVQTDLDGNFQIAANENETLEFSFIGYNNQEIIVSKSKIVNVSMYADVLGMGAFVVVNKRTFFGRIFHNMAAGFAK